MNTLTHYTEIARQYAPKGKITECARLWYDISKRRWENKIGRDPLPTKPGQMIARFVERNRQMFVREIARRGFDTEIQQQHGKAIELQVLNRKDGLWLLGCSGWRHYSNRFGQRFAEIAYLCGKDDNGLWAVRVPGATVTVDEALDYTIPAEVKKARMAGKRVLRQGDVFAIQMKRDSNHDLPRGHRFDVSTRILTHEGGHEALHVPFPCKFVTAQGLAPRRAYSRNRYWD